MADRNAWKGENHTRRRKFRRMISLSSHISFRLGRWFPNSIPLVYVVGYPKSGTSWAAQMVADYFQLPFPQHAIFPIGFPAIFQGHQSIDRKYPNGVYTIRDGRDVMVSGFFHLKSQYLAKGGSGTHKKFFQRINLDSPASEHLPAFIEHAAQHPFACRLNWGDHITTYFKSANENVHLIRYEELLSDPIAALTAVVEKLTSSAVAPLRISETVERFDFKRQATTDQKDSYLRKGQKGDWTNHFNRESADVFNRYFGKALVLAGYEPDQSWVNQVLN